MRVYDLVRREIVDNLIPSIKNIIKLWKIRQVKKNEISQFLQIILRIQFKFKKYFSLLN
jgi:hypothetical protein